MTQSFDPAKRAAEKQASRDQDEEDLRTGKKTREQLRKENGAFGFPPDRVRINYLPNTPGTRQNDLESILRRIRGR